MSLAVAWPSRAGDVARLSLIEVYPGVDWMVTISKDWRAASGKCKIFSTRPVGTLDKLRAPEAELKADGSAYRLRATEGKVANYWLVVYPTTMSVDLTLNFEKAGKEHDVNTASLRLKHLAIGDKITKADVIFTEAPGARCETSGYRATPADSNSNNHIFIYLGAQPNAFDQAQH